MHTLLINTLTHSLSLTLSHTHSLTLTLSHTHLNLSGDLDSFTDEVTNDISVTHNDVVRVLLLHIQT